jgi:6-phosphogluconate dehydrogenase
LRLYTKVCSYAQGMNLIRAKSVEQGWDLDLGRGLHSSTSQLNLSRV